MIVYGLGLFVYGISGGPDWADTLIPIAMLCFSFLLFLFVLFLNAMHMGYKKRVKSNLKTKG